MRNQVVVSAGGLSLLGILLISTAATAQTYSVLHSFGILTNVTGTHPQSMLVQGADGTLYGTTSAGEGNVGGTVFKVQPDGSGFTVLKLFTNYTDGASPRAGLTLSGSSLYGTTYYGGSAGSGTVFKLNTDGTGYTVLKNFTGSPDGANPQAALTLSGSTLYGTTYSGGSANGGTVFKLNTDGTGYTVLRNIGGFDGSQPQAGLTLSGNTLYGETSVGGSGSWGTVFKLNTDGTGFTVLRSFAFSYTDGAEPWAGLTLSGSTLYGVTSGGGPTFAGTVFKINTDGTGYAVLLAGGGFGGPDGELTLSGSTLYGTTSGTVFKINTDGTGYNVLWNFTGPPDAAYARAGVTLSGSTLYGTTYSGGTSDQGTVFKLNTDGTGYALLENFTYSDGQLPYVGLTLSGTMLYGTTYLGGSWDGGTVFSINTDGTGYTVLHSFAGTLDGQWPYAKVTLSGSVLYGTTYQGGGWGDGTVFSVNTDGTGFTNLHTFTATSGVPPYTNSDGANPSADLTLSGSVLYGTAYQGGASGHGTVFSLNTDGTGYTALYNFPNITNGDFPSAGLTLSGSTLFGTTRVGGSAENGTVFKLNTDGTGYTVLYNFTNITNGAQPTAGLTLSGSTLYGTASLGGTSNYGTVFKLNTDGTGYTVLKNFTGSPDGATPSGNLTLSGSTLYGTTFQGGTSDLGTVFKLNTDGTGYVVLKNFATSDGQVPNGGLMLSGTMLYGTTYQGGSLNEGVVFSLNLAPVLNITAIPGRVVLSWADPAFSLQSAPEVAGAYTNIPAATSPYTNMISGGRQFFRLVGN